MDSPPIPFGLDPTTFATVVALTVLLVTRVIDAMLPKGKVFRFTRSWFVDGDKVKEEVTERPLRDSDTGQPVTSREDSDADRPNR